MVHCIWNHTKHLHILIVSSAPTFDEEWVVTTLSQLHHDVEEGGDGRGTALRQEGEVTLQDGAVVLFLDYG